MSAFALEGPLAGLGNTRGFFASPPAKWKVPCFFFFLRIGLFSRPPPRLRHFFLFLLLLSVSSLSSPLEPFFSCISALALAKSFSLFRRGVTVRRPRLFKFLYIPPHPRLPCNAWMFASGLAPRRSGSVLALPISALLYRPIDLSLPPCSNEALLGFL